MTNTPVTQIIEWVDAQILSCTADEQDRCRIEELERMREYALTMLPVEEAEFIQTFKDGVGKGKFHGEASELISVDKYFKSNYNQYAGDNNK